MPQQTSDARRFGREAGTYLIGFALLGAIQFLALPIYARVLGPEGYGLYSLTIASVTLLSGIMLLGGDTALARFWGEAADRAARRTLASSWILFLTLWSLLVTAVAVLGAPALAGVLRPGSDYAAALILGILGIAPAQLSRMLAQILRNTFRPVLFAASSVVIAAIDVMLSLLLGVVLGLGLNGIMAGIVIGELLGSLMRVFIVRSWLGRPLDARVIGPLLRYGVPVVPASIAAWAMQSTDRLVLGATAEPAALGAYGMAVSLVGPFTVITLSLGQAWIPRVVALHTRDPRKARAATSDAIGYSLAGIGSVALLVGACAPLLLEVVGGPDFVDGAVALPLLALGAAFGGVGLFTATGLQIMKRTPTFSAVAVAAAVVNFALLLAIVPVAGLAGAAASVAVSYLLYMIATAWFANRVFPLTMPWWRLAAMVVVLFGAAAVNTVRPSTAAVVAATLVSILLLASLMPNGLSRLRPARP